MLLALPFAFLTSCRISRRGALSASFIPVYAKLLAADDEAEASRVANAVLGLLALVTSLIVLVGVLTTPYLIDLIAPGFSGETRELTIRLVKILFPGAGLLVLSAWCLGVLNSHHRFFISYTAPVVWNLAIIAALIIFGNKVGQFPLAEYTAWGSVIGSAYSLESNSPRLKTSAPTAAGDRYRKLSSADCGQKLLSSFHEPGVIQISAFVMQSSPAFYRQAPSWLLPTHKVSTPCRSVSLACPFPQLSCRQCRGRSVPMKKWRTSCERDSTRG